MTRAGPRYEIELRFLVECGDWPRSPRPAALEQGYLSTDPARVVRVRLREADGLLTIKGRARGARRLELEYPIPRADAQTLLELCPFRVRKQRHLAQLGDRTWEIDVFEGRNAGLVVAEVELEDERHAERVRASLPPWAGPEITLAHEYTNLRLAQRPYAEWTEQERRKILGIRF